MATIKSDYFIKGVDNQKRSDLTVLLKYPSLKKINSLPKEDRDKITQFLNDRKLELTVLIHSIHD